MCDDDSNSNSSGELIAGITLAVASSLISNVGVNLQKRSFIREAAKPPSERRPYAKQPAWFGGMGLVILAALVSFASFALAPQSVVAPIGALVLVWNLLFAHKWLGEDLSRRDVTGTLVVIAGVVVIVAFGSRKSTCFALDEIEQRYTTPEVWAYFGGFLVIAGTYYAIQRRASTILIDLVRLMFSSSASSPTPQGQGQGQGASYGDPVDHSNGARSDEDNQPQSETSKYKSLKDSGDNKKSKMHVNTQQNGQKKDQAPNVPKLRTANPDSVCVTIIEEKSPRQGESDRSLQSNKQSQNEIDGVNKIEDADEKNTSRSLDEDSALETFKIRLTDREVARLISRPPPEYKSFSKLHPLALSGLTGVIGAQNTLFSKTVGEMLKVSIAGDMQMGQPLFFVFLLGLVTSIVVQQHFMARSLQVFDALYVVPVFQAHFILTSIISGGINFLEFSSFETINFVMFPIGVLILIAGIVILSGRQMQDREGPLYEAAPIEDVAPVYEFEAHAMEKTTIKQSEHEEILSTKSAPRPTIVPSPSQESLVRRSSLPRMDFEQHIDGLIRDLPVLRRSKSWGADQPRRPATQLFGTPRPSSEVPDMFFRPNESTQTPQLDRNIDAVALLTARSPVNYNYTEVCSRAAIANYHLGCARDYQSSTSRTNTGRRPTLAAPRLYQEDTADFWWPQGQDLTAKLLYGGRGEDVNDNMSTTRPGHEGISSAINHQNSHVSMSERRRGRNTTIVSVDGSVVEARRSISPNTAATERHRRTSKSRRQTIGPLVHAHTVGEPECQKKNQENHQNGHEFLSGDETSVSPHRQTSERPQRSRARTLQITGLTNYASSSIEEDTNTSHQHPSSTRARRPRAQSTFLERFGSGLSFLTTTNLAYAALRGCGDDVLRRQSIVRPSVRQPPSPPPLPQDSVNVPSDSVDITIHNDDQQTEEQT